MTVRSVAVEQAKHEEANDMQVARTHRIIFLGCIGMFWNICGCHGVFSGVLEGDGGGDAAPRIDAKPNVDGATVVDGGGPADGSSATDASAPDGTLVDGGPLDPDGAIDGPPDPCAGVDCGAHGHCVDNGGQAACDCDPGYHADGLTCVEDDPCAGVNCSGHGDCLVDGSNNPYCDCDAGYHADGLTCVEDDPCAGVNCSGHGDCLVDGSNNPYCDCDTGYTAQGLFCVEDTDPCSGQNCSGHGTCMVWDGIPVCACDAGYTPSSSVGLDCVDTDTVCVGGPINYDYDNDGTTDTWFEPSAWECWMYELVNYTRATHDDEGSPECHTPLMWDVEWAAHGRNHSHQMEDQGGLFHADFPSGQNCAYGCDPPCEMDMYMTGPNEPHCPDLSHHCNIMRCSFSHIGIGYVGTWNTQNFY
jgi:hypothetical protein